MFSLSAQDLLNPQLMDILCNNMDDDFIKVSPCNIGTVAKCVSLGFLPFACWGSFVPKLHEKRCCMEIEDLHLSKSTIKHAKYFNFCVDQEKEHITKELLPKYHGSCWLEGQLLTTLLMLSPSKKDTTSYKIPRFLTFEVRNKETGKIAAADIGYIFGGCYTSMSGLTVEKNAGSVLLLSLGRYLRVKGIKYWDFGMHMAYKSALGAKMIPRKEWVKLVEKIKQIELLAPINENCEIDCQKLIKDMEIHIEHETVRPGRIDVKKLKSEKELRES
eukprot:GDKJ01026273.1.p1 GENE.GDKJ01026273.1~~GDKJ01026273.1.p1  ORF type:complete len:274 (-),score=27.06 GDKJ01026273.1:537-1358(-)